jgi:hypothetical protein
MIEKKLGKIESVKFGHVGYQDAMLGLDLTFSFNGGGIGTGGLKGLTWDPELIECTKYSKWTEEDRDFHFAEHMRYISKLLNDAKVNDVYKLKGIPVEITIENRTFKDFRVLTEVL